VRSIINQNNDSKIILTTQKIYTMRKIVLTVAMISLGTTALFAQKYMTRTAKVTFNATAEGSPEKIEAINNEVANIFDGKTGDVVFQMPIKSFKFERALMQEHFNENYMESDKYPKAEFKGAFTDMSGIDLNKDGTYDTKVTGKLTIHGVTNEVKVPGAVQVKGGNVMLKSKFVVKLADYKVAVPGVVADKVAKEARITIESTLTQK